jgi:Flp pilus assembly protein TadD
MNEPSPEHIPGRSRRLVVLLCIALAVGLAAAGAVVLGSRGGGASAATGPARCRPLSGAPPLNLQLPGNPDATGTRAIAAAAVRLLPPGDPRVGVARAIVDYPQTGAAGTLSALRRLDQSQPVVRLYEGLTELWAGRCRQAVATLRQVRSTDLYGYSGTIADTALHTPQQRAAYPVYIPPEGTPAGTVVHLRSLVRRHPRDSGAWLGLAVAEQSAWLHSYRAGDRRAAQAAARRALELDPTGVSPRIAVAVLTYDKDRPAATFSQLGPLVQQASDPTEVRFHLGILLFWLHDDTDAAAQWRQVVDASPDSVYGRTAAQLMSKIS